MWTQVYEHRHEMSTQGPSLEAKSTSSSMFCAFQCIIAKQWLDQIAYGVKQLSGQGTIF